MTMELLSEAEYNVAKAKLAELLKKAPGRHANPTEYTEMWKLAVDVENYEWEHNPRSSDIRALNKYRQNIADEVDDTTLRGYNVISGINRNVIEKEYLRATTREDDLYD